MAGPCYLLRLSPEVYHNILLEVEPSDLAALSASCRKLRGFIARDELLWKRLYLKRFDAPASSLTNDSAGDSWQQPLKELTRIEKLLQSDNVDIKTNEAALESVHDAMSTLLLSSTNLPHQNANFLTHHFSSESNISSFLCRSSLFNAARFKTDSAASSFALRQLSAKLAVYYGLELEPNSTSVVTGIANSVHPYARSRVYDLRRYNAANLWGPFLDDGSQGTDWEKVHCILLDLLYNLRTYTERRSPSITPTSTSPDTTSPSSSSSSSRSSSQLWDAPFRGLAPNSYTSLALSGPIATDPHPDLTALDPYGVTGTWMRIVCFLDYNDLYSFNFESPIAIPLSRDRPPIDTREAFRLIRLQLRVTSIEEDVEAQGEAKRLNRPIVHFEGKSKSTYMAWDHNANSRIRGEFWKTVGSVRTTPTGAIRWTTFSIFGGEERWRSEGVQIGGIRSARGILGNWFDKDFDIHGPAGPTCFWKVSDDVQEEKRRDLSAFGIGVGVLWVPPFQEVVNVLFE